MKKIIICILMGITLLNCSSDNNTDDTTTIDYTQYSTQNTIASNIHFMAEERFADANSPQVADLQLKLITEEVYPCVNYSLLTSEFLIKDELIVRFDEVAEPIGCLTAIGPAISYIDLPENIRYLTLLNGNTIDKYAVEITAEKVIVTLIETNFTLSLHNNTFRIPENSFAFVCGTTTDATLIYQDFATILDQNPDFVEFQFVGEGRIPYPEVSSGHWVNHPAKYYSYTNPAAFSNLATTINNYATQNLQNTSGTSLSIYGWNNVNYYSWIDN